MATLSFYARGTVNIAGDKIPVLDNLNQTPTTEITFTDEGTGDLKLEANGGLPDTDTKVIIDGVTMSFTLIYSGEVPDSSRFAHVAGTDMRGKEVAIIETANGDQYFFVTDGSGTLEIMNAMQAGAQVITKANKDTSVLVCFLRGTLIDTPQGQKPIETLRIGDQISTYDGNILPLRWVGHRHVTAAELLLHPELRPIVLPQDMFGDGLPARRLKLSPSHRLAIGGWQAEMLFGFDTALIRANYLLGEGAARVNPNRGIDYYHLLLDDHTLVLANGLACESFQLGARGELALEQDDLAILATACPGQTLADLLERPDCLPSLKAGQAKVLLNWSQKQAQAATVDNAEKIARAVSHLAA